MTTESAAKTRLIPIPNWNEFHPWPTAPGLRWLVFNAEKNGFSKCIRRCGRRVLIDEAAFFEWIKSNPTAKASR